MRSSLRYRTPIGAVGWKKLRPLGRLAVSWVVAHGVIYDGSRVDVVRGARVARRDSRSSAFAVWAATLLEQVCLVKGEAALPDSAS